MPFRITGLSPDPFRPLFGLSDQELAAKGVRRYVADSKPGFPDRVDMRVCLADGEPHRADLGPVRCVAGVGDRDLPRIRIPPLGAGPPPGRSADVAICFTKYRHMSRHKT